MEYLIDAYQNLIYSICFKSVGNPFDAEDLTQEVFLSAYKKLNAFDKTYEKAWLCKIATNKCLDHLKNAGRRIIPTENTYFTDMQANYDSPEDTYLKTEWKQQVLSLCKTLKEPYADIAKQHFYQELSAGEIAHQTGKNLKTVQTQIYRAKAMLKKSLERGEMT